MGLPVPENIDVLPNTKVTVHDIPDLKKVDVNALTVHGDYIIYTWASAPTDQKDWTAKSVAKALQLQEPLLDKFPATPKDKTKELKIDQNDLLIYAVPNKEGDARQTSQMAVYGPRGMAHRSTNPQLTYEVLTGAGVEHAASYNTSVYRAASADDAITVLDAFVDDLTAAASPPHRRPQDCRTPSAWPRTPPRVRRTTATWSTAATWAKRVDSTRRTSTSRSRRST